MTTRITRHRGLQTNQEESRANRTDVAEARSHRTLVVNENGKYFFKSIAEGNKV